MLAKNKANPNPEPEPTSLDPSTYFAHGDYYKELLLLTADCGSETPMKLSFIVMDYARALASGPMVLTCFFLSLSLSSSLFSFSFWLLPGCWALGWAVLISIDP